MLLTSIVSVGLQKLHHRNQKYSTETTKFQKLQILTGTTGPYTCFRVEKRSKEVEVEDESKAKGMECLGF